MLMYFLYVIKWTGNVVRQLLVPLIISITMNAINSVKPYKMPNMEKKEILPEKNIFLSVSGNMVRNLKISTYFGKFPHFDAFLKWNCEIFKLTRCIRYMLQTRYTSIYIYPEQMYAPPYPAPMAYNSHHIYFVKEWRR